MKTTTVFNTGKTDVVKREVREISIPNIRDTRLIEGMDSTQLSDLIDRVIAKLELSNPGITKMLFYRKLVQELPKSLHSETIERCVEETMSPDTATTERAKKVLLYLNLKSIMSSFDALTNRGRKIDAEKCAELIEQVMSHVLQSLADIKTERELRNLEQQRLSTTIYKISAEQLKALLRKERS